MPTINEHFSKEEMEFLKKGKNGKTWKDYIIECTETKLGEKFNG